MATPSIPRRGTEELEGNSRIQRAQPMGPELESLARAEEIKANAESRRKKPRSVGGRKLGTLGQKKTPGQCSPDSLLEEETEKGPQERRASFPAACPLLPGCPREWFVLTAPCC